MRFVSEIVETLTRCLEAKDPYTAFHSDRVAAIARDIALEMGLPPDQVKTVQTGAKLHDIGKLKVPETVLRKEGKLSQEEWLNITKHPEYGVGLLKPLEPFLGEVFSVVLHHHERWDGRGYPHKKAGYEIPLFARIVAVADAYEAMTSDRPYRRAKRPEEALQEIQDLAGIQFDPRVVEAFTRAWRKNPSWRNKSEYVKSTIF
jgi:HD-GYP domain-containing protein (c-di-GMP phosphodiesterase class II)